MATAFKSDFLTDDACAAEVIIGRQWYSAAELAALSLPGLPGTKRKINELARADRWSERFGASGAPLARPRAGRGGGIEFHIDVLPPAARFKLAQEATAANTDTASSEAAQANWDWFDEQPDHVKVEARRREAVLASVAAFMAAGSTKSMAVQSAARQHGVSPSAIWGWQKLVKGVADHDMIVHLAPRWQGGGKAAEISNDVWRFFLSMYLAPERRCIANCYRRTQQYAQGAGLPLPLPHWRTFQRRLEREIDPAVVAKRRHGREALNLTMPAQKRSVRNLHAMEIVNVDGHKFDVFVRFPDGEIERVMMVAIQDVYSRKVLAWRFDKSENTTVTRLAFADLFRDWGIPKAVLFDNGRAFASKQITGGAKTRFRNKILENEPTGIIPALGINPMWATPYHGQAKPIERQFRDYCEDIAKHPEFTGAWCGNNPMAKPENYQSKAVDFDLFVEIVSEEIRRNNARMGRETEICAGVSSFDEVFEASYAIAPIGKATDVQLRLALLSSEVVRTHRRDGSINFAGNTYWVPELSTMPGARVLIRYDPDDLHSEVHVYTQDDSFILTAKVWAAAGFATQEDARQLAKARSAYRKAVKKQEDALELLDGKAMAAALPRNPKPDAPQQAPSVTRIVHYQGNAARKVQPEIEPSEAPQKAPTPNFIDQFAAVTNRLRVVE